MTYLTRNQGQGAEQVFLQLQFPAVCNRVREMQVGGTRKAELCHKVVLFRDCHPSLCLTESLRIETYNVNIKGQKQKQEEEKMLRKSQFFGTDIPELSVSMEMIGNCS